MDGVRESNELRRAVAAAWRSFGAAASLEARVSPAIPILFFGDLDAYAESQQRVLTVGLNPSLIEFPTGDPFRRFPLAEDAHPEDQERYLDALSAYFRARPYKRWFRSYGPLLNGMDASYCDHQTSTALHTDICSPIATNPTWTRLSEADQGRLLADGRPLWHKLLVALQPNVVILSVAKHHLDHISFDPLGPWELIHSINRKRDGTPRSSPYAVTSCWYMVGTKPALFVFGTASQTPFGSISNNQKTELGAIVVDTYRNALLDKRSPASAPLTSGGGRQRGLTTG